MSNLSNKIVQIILWVLMAVSIIFAVIFYLGSVVDGTEGTRLEEPVITQSFLTWAYILFFATLAITIVFSIINIVVNPKGIKGAIIALIFGAVLITAAFLMSDGTLLDLPHYSGKDNIPSTLKFVDTVLYSTYILLGLAILSIVYSSVSRLFKK